MVEEIHQAVLLMPEDISHHAADAVAPHLRARTPAGGKTNLNWNVGAYVASRDHSESNLHRTDIDKPHVASTSIEKWPDEPTALQAVGAGKLVSGHSSTGRPLRLTCRTWSR